MPSVNTSTQFSSCFKKSTFLSEQVHEKLVLTQKENQNSIHTFDFVIVGTILYFFLRALGQNTDSKPQVDDLLIDIRDELRKLNAKK